MAKAEYRQLGEHLDYKNAGDAVIEAGDVVELDSRIGVAGCDIQPGEIGVLVMNGVYRIKKTGTVAVVMGKPVYFDGTGITNTATSNTAAGYAAAPAAAADTEILVKLLG